MRYWQQFYCNSIRHKHENCGNMFALCAVHCWKDNKNRVVAAATAAMPFSRFSSGHYQIVICVTLRAGPPLMTSHQTGDELVFSPPETSPNIAWHQRVCSAGKISKPQNEIKSQKKPPEEELESELMRWVWGIILRKNKETDVYRIRSVILQPEVKPVEN